LALDKALFAESFLFGSQQRLELSAKAQFPVVTLPHGRYRNMYPDKTKLSLRTIITTILLISIQ
jgi:hypothetical protein